MVPKPTRFRTSSPMGFSARGYNWASPVCRRRLASGCLLNHVGRSAPGLYILANGPVPERKPEAKETADPPDRKIG
jgi:hypothetical protein